MGVERYLRERFLDADAFAAACGIGADELSALIERGLAPRPAYVIDEAGRMRSFVFGEIESPGAPAGRWFNRRSTHWVARARDALAAHDGDANAASDALQARFRGAYLQALRESHAIDGPIPGFVDGAGHFDEASFDAEFASIWRHFLEGTYGLCVADPQDEAHIVAKEAAQARLTSLTANGTRRDYAGDEKARVRDLIARYETLSMPFSPAEYARSSRKRLIEDVRGALSNECGATSNE